MLPPHFISKATITRPSVYIARPRRWILTFHLHLFLCWHKCTSKWESPIKLLRNVKKPSQFSDAIPQFCQYWDMFTPFQEDAVKRKVSSPKLKAFGNDVTFHPLMCRSLRRAGGQTPENRPA